MASSHETQFHKSTEVTFTLRKPLYTYLHLRASDRSSQSTAPPTLDEISVRQYIAQALTQYLGLTGSAIDVDILKVEGQDAWIRVAYDEENAVVTSLSQWSGKGIFLTVRNRATWLGALTARETSQELWSMAS